MINNKQRGFTIIELMIAIAIVGVLAAIAIPSYQDYIKRAKVSEGLVLAAQAKIAVAEYYQSNGSFPSTTAQAGLSTIAGNSVSGISVNTSGLIDITYKTAANGGVGTNSLVLRLTPTESSGVITWAVTSTGTTGVPSKWCPSNASCAGTGS